LKSLLNQDADFEILVLDDASTDDTLSLVRSLNDERIRIFPLEHNQGRPANANRGFDLCRGEYIARIDHDDLAEPGRLRKQADFLDANPDVTVVGSQIRLFGDEESITDFPLDDATIKGRFLLGAAYLANPSTMFRRAFIQKHAIRYDPNLDIVDALIKLHRSVGVAISDIDMTWGASRVELEGRLLGMLNEVVKAREQVYPRSPEHIALCTEALWEGVRSNNAA
jgi:glycosyltransferase involved in cell wall biosynthesis